MEPGERTDFSAWPPVILVILLATTSAYLGRMTLESERPPPTGQGVSATGIQDREARLWQDPFAVATKKSEPPSCHEGKPEEAAAALTLRPCQKGNGGSSPHDLKWLRELVHKRGGKVRILYALVPGGTWVGADEYRRRHRYAILAGANRLGYTPDDPEHLGYLEQTIKSRRRDVSDKLLPPWQARLPFEWLSHHQRSESVLLVWVDEEPLAQPVAGSASIASYPLARLTDLIDNLEPTNTKTTHSIIGPFSSTFLSAVATEPGLILTAERLKEIEWYSPSATMPDKYLKVGNNGTALADILPKFHRMIVSDDELAKALAEEIKLRNVGPGQVIALVGLWDTVYARRLRHLIEDHISRDRADSAFPPGEAPTIITASYLRGVDGRLPHRGDEQENKNAGTHDDREKPADRVERPEGDAQIDYLRRLALELKRWQREEGKPVAAIGVIGDDYHDKLIALRALRPSFPGAVFFTTDLDAAMLHPADNKVTRNLVVASGYGLRLRPELQGDIPPFRYSYQSAAFLATQVALGDRKFVVLPPRHDQENKCLLRAQLFEIGYTEAVVLKGRRQEGSDCDVAQPPYKDPHPLGRPLPAWRAALSPPTAVLLAGLLLWVTGFAHRGHLLSWVMGVVGVGALSFGMISLLRFEPEMREPFSLLQGVSIWPSVLLRLLAIVVAVALLLRGRRLLRDNIMAIEKAYPELEAAPYARGVQPERSETNMRLTPLQRIRRWFDCAEPVDSIMDAPGLWRIYRRDCWNSGRDGVPQSASNAMQAPRDIKRAYGSSMLACLPFWFAGAAFIASAVLCASGLISVFGKSPNTPNRGTIELWINGVVLVGAVLTFLLLLFQAAYESFRAVWLTGRLQSQHAWSEVTLKVLDPQQQCLSRAPSAPPGSTLAALLDVDLIARVTEPVQRIVFYPFAVLALLILARSSLFDAWDMPGFLAALFCIYILLLVAAAWRLRTTAEKLRRRVEKQITKDILDAKMACCPDVATQLQAMLDYLKSLLTGAFLPFSQQPLVRAALTVLGSYSGVTLLEYAQFINL